MLGLAQHLFRWLGVSPLPSLTELDRRADNPQVQMEAVRTWVERAKAAVAAGDRRALRDLRRKIRGFADDETPLTRDRVDDLYDDALLALTGTKDSESLHAAEEALLQQLEEAAMRKER